jgi:hypothetical protein
MENLHSPEMVAEHLIEGIKNGDIDVILSDINSVKLNREHPLEFDKKSAEMFEALKKRTEEHRSM